MALMIDTKSKKFFSTVFAEDIHLIFFAFRLKNLAQKRRNMLNEAQTLNEFFRDIDDEESWIR